MASIAASLEFHLTRHRPVRVRLPPRSNQSVSRQSRDAAPCHSPPQTATDSSCNPKPAHRQSKPPCSAFPSFPNCERPPQSRECLHRSEEHTSELQSPTKLVC